MEFSKLRSEIHGREMGLSIQSGTWYTIMLNFDTPKLKMRSKIPLSETGSNPAANGTEPEAPFLIFFFLDFDKDCYHLFRDDTYNHKDSISSMIEELRNL